MSPPRLWGGVLLAVQVFELLLLPHLARGVTEFPNGEARERCACVVPACCPRGCWTVAHGCLVCAWGRLMVAGAFWGWAWAWMSGVCRASDDAADRVQ